MTRQTTVDRLHDMRLSAMANAFESQCEDDAFESLSFEDRFGMLVDKEWEKRQNTKLSKLIKAAGFRYPNACMEDIEYFADRKLDKAQLLELSTCRYISEGRHIILKGATGCGKTYLSNALGNAACRNFIKVKYIRLPDLFVELSIAQAEGTFRKVIKFYQRIDLLILDEFLLTPLTGEEARMLLEIIEAKTRYGSVIFCSQFEPKGWIKRIGSEADATLAEATLDRFKHSSYIIDIKGDVSMRERHGIKSKAVVHHD